MIKTFWLAAIALQATTDAVSLSKTEAKKEAKPKAGKDMQADAVEISKSLFLLAIQAERQVKEGSCADPYPKKYRK